MFKIKRCMTFIIYDDIVDSPYNSLWKDKNGTIQTLRADPALIPNFSEFILNAKYELQIQFRADECLPYSYIGEIINAKIKE